MLTFSGITLTNDKNRRKNSYNITVCSWFRTYWTLSGVSRSVQSTILNRCFFKNEPIILCLTYFYFPWTVLSKKYLEEFDGKSTF